MNNYQTDPEITYDKLDEIRVKISDTTNLMKNNIEQVIQRGENIENVEEKSEELQNSALQFKNQSASYRRKMCWKNAKYPLCIFLGMVFFVVFVIMVSKS
jgi:vesicle-associated membrane protein 4